MAEPNVGIAGSARLASLSGAGLALAERHGKRLDQSSQSRKINDRLPLTTTGYDLSKLRTSHLENVVVRKGPTKALHLIVQFPKDLVQDKTAAWKLEQARAYAERVFGPDSVFADRLDLDEKNQDVVDIFLAPLYVKKTKRAERQAFSTTHHLVQQAKKHDRPTTARGKGQAMQDELFQFFKEIGLEGVQRGSEKERPGPDWKSSEELRATELAEQENASIALVHGLVELGDKLAQERLAFESEVISQRSEIESDRVSASKRAAEAASAARAAIDAAEAAKAAAEAEKTKLVQEKSRLDVATEQLIAAQVQFAQDHGELAAKKAAAEKEIEHNKAKAAAQIARQQDALASELFKLSEKAKALESKRSKFEKDQSKLADDQLALHEKEKVVAAMQTGLDAIADGRIVKARVKNGQPGLIFSADILADPDARSDLKSSITPAWGRIWEVAKRVAGLGQIRDAYLAETQKLKTIANQLVAALEKVPAPDRAAVLREPDVNIANAIAGEVISEPAPEGPSLLDQQMFQKWKDGQGIG